MDIESFFKRLKQLGFKIGPKHLLIKKKRYIMVTKLLEKEFKVNTGNSLNIVLLKILYICIYIIHVKLN